VGAPAIGLARHNKRFTVKEIIKIVAIRCQILRLKCTKSFVGWGSAPYPAGGAYSATPDLSSWILGGLLLRERGRDERVRQRKGGDWLEGRDGEGRAGEGEGAGSAPKIKLGPKDYFPGAGAAQEHTKSADFCQGESGSDPESSDFRTLVGFPSPTIHVL